MSNRFKDLFDQADDAFNGKHKVELDQLQGLSKNDVDSVTPGTEDLRVYSVLIEVVKQASRDNLTQAELIDNIKELGGVAIKIAKKIPKFAALL